MWTLAAGALAALLYSATLMWLAYDYASSSCDADKWKRQYEHAQKQIEAHQQAAKADQQVLEEARKETERLKGVGRELAAKISDGVCFSERDTDSLRKLWTDPS